MRVYVCVFVRLEDGRLLDYLVAHDELMEEKVSFFIREILEALQHLHTCRVAHLDLKVRPSCVMRSNSCFKAQMQELRSVSPAA